MDLGLSGRTCVVTGASRGIGRATAVRLAHEGARVLLTARGEEELEAARAETEAAGRGSGGGAAAVALDVTAPDAGAAILAASEERLGPPDVLVNNAGTTRMVAWDDLDDAEWQLQWELNVMASLRVARALAPGMAERGWGRIVNVASSAGKRPSLRNAAYSVGKSAQLSLSRVLAEAYAGTGVLVNAVAPGPTETPLWLGPGGLVDQTVAAGQKSREEVLAAERSRQLLGRLGGEDEIAAVVVFLCSEAASNVLGAAWSVDGGTVRSIV